MSAPCKDCPDRVLGCHSTCEKYIEYNKQRQEIREKRYIEYERLHDVIVSCRHRRKKKKR